MKLSDILPEVITETNKNLKEYENIINTSIIELTKKEIKKDIEEYFQNIMKNLIESITNKVITEFNDFWQIEKRENEFKNMVNELNKNNKYLNDYIEDIPTKNFDSKINQKINESIEQLESIYGKEASDFVCGKYLIESLSRYLGSKLKKKKIGYDELKSFLISNFDVEEIGYIKEKLFYYIAH